MMFKVGQKVWNKDSKKKNTIIKIVESGFTKVTLYELENSKATLYELDNYSIHDESDLHQTADDMFEALGFERNEPLAHLIRYTHNNDGYIININFNLSKQVYYVDNQNGTACGILKEEHLAIHQKLIEFGWL